MKNNSLKNVNKKIARQDMIEAGGYDGRFRNKVVPDKKKVRNKKFARTKVSW